MTDLAIFDSLSYVLLHHITFYIKKGIKYRTFEGDLENVGINCVNIEQTHPNIYKLAFATPLFVSNGVCRQFDSILPQVMKDDWIANNVSNVIFVASIIDYLKCHYEWTPTMLSSWIETIEQFIQSSEKKEE